MAVCYIFQIQIPKIWGFFSTPNHPLVYSFQLASCMASHYTSSFLFIMILVTIYHILACLLQQIARVLQQAEQWKTIIICCAWIKDIEQKNHIQTCLVQWVTLHNIYRPSIFFCVDCSCSTVHCCKKKESIILNSFCAKRMHDLQFLFCFFQKKEKGMHQSEFVFCF